MRELEDSPLGAVILEAIKPSREYSKRARDLAEEETELAERAQRDRKQRSQDVDRRREIELERERLRKEFEAAKAREAAEKLKQNEKELVAVAPSLDETSADVGLLTLAKECPACGEPMRMRQSGYQLGKGRRSFWWQCTAVRAQPCRSVPFDPQAENVTVLRMEDADLDGPSDARRRIWEEPKTLAETHTRLRKHLGEEDPEIPCPQHLLPMRLLQRRNAGGRLLDSYDYVCAQVYADGRACTQSVPVETFPQVAAALRRLEGRGIILERVA